jgi:uncharacterized delta-60 repeat protein
MIGQHYPRALQMLQMKTRLVWMGLLALLLLPAGGWSAGGDLITPPWPFVFGMAGSQDVRASAVDAQGNIILVGATGADQDDFLVVKVAADGSGPAWTAATFDLDGGQDVATAVAVDRQGDILVTGYGVNGSSFDIHTIKYNGNTGEVLWQDTWGSSSANDYVTAIAVDSLNNVYVAGYTQSQGGSGPDDCLLIKYSPDGTNPDGTPLWIATWNHASVGGHDRVYAIAAGPDGVALTGESQTAAGNFDLLTLKYGFDGAPTWTQERRYLSAAGGSSLGNAVQMDAAGNVVVAGYVYNGSDAKKDFWVAKYPAGDGPALWAPPPVDNGFNDEALALAIDESGDVYATGTTFLLSTSKDIQTVRYDGTTGSQVWTKTYNSFDGNNETALALTVDPGGDLFVVGYLDYATTGEDDFLVLKYRNVKNQDGIGSATLLWASTAGSGARNDRAIGLGRHDGQVLVAGWSDRGTAELPDIDYIALGYDAAGLDPPTGLTAQVVSNTQISLGWQDNSANNEEFIIQRRAWDIGEWTEAGRVGADVIVFPDGGLDPDTRYTYRVLAANSTQGTSNPSDPVTVRTTIISYDPPAWQFLFNSGDNDYPAGIAVGPDAHPVVTGDSFTLDSAADYYTIKLDRTLATELWHGSYDDPDSESDYAKAVAVDATNQVIVTGFASLYADGGAGNTNDIYTLWYAADGLPRDVDGNSVKLRGDPYNGPSGSDDRSSAVATAVDNSNNSVVVGYGKNADLNDDLYVIKFRSDRSRAWAATPYNSGGDDYPAAVAIDRNGDIFVGGYSWNGSSQDFFAAKYQGSDGVMLWKAAFDQAGGSDYIEDLAVDAAGHLYVTGYSVNASGNGDFYTIKFDGAGDGIPVNGVAGGRILWQQGYDGGGYDKAEAIRVDPVTGEILVAGTTFRGAGNQDFHVIRYTAAGESGAGKVVWAKTLDQPTNDSVAAMDVDWSGTACVVGVAATGANSNMLSVKFDPLGTVIGANVFAGSAGGEDEPVAVVVNTYGEAFVAGFTTNSAGNADYLVFKAEGEVMQAPLPLAATQSYTRVDLSWVDHSLNDSGFRIERKTGACSENVPWVWVVDTDPNVIVHGDDNLNTGSTYCYRAASFNAGGELSPWAQVEVTTSAPPAPCELACEIRSTTEIALNWQDNTAGEDAFRFERCNGATCETFDVGANKEDHIDGAVCPGGTYSYRVQARRTNAWVTAWSNGCSGLTTPAPQAPAGLIAPDVRENAVELAWQVTTADESSFIVERCPGQGTACDEDNEFTLLPGSAPAVFSGLHLYYRMEEAAWSGVAGEVIDHSGQGKNGNSYGGAITAVGGKYGRGGSFDGSNDYVATPLTIDQSAASAGVTLQAWVRPDADSVGYRFVLGTDNGGNDWGILLIDSNWYVATGESYYYTGVAASLGQWQHVAAAFTPGSGVRFYKNGVEFAILQIGYDTSTSPLQVGRMGSSSHYFKGMIDEVAVHNRPLTAGEIQSLYQYGIARYADTPPTHSSWYTYRVRAHKDATCPWDSSASNSVEVQTLPKAPDNLTATALDNSRVRLQWRDNTNLESGFRIFRDGAEILPAAGANALEFTDSSVCANNSYTYQITAFRSGEWESPPSNPASASTSAPQLPTVSLPITSEERIEFDWTYPNKDYTAFHLSRCQVTAEITCTQDDQFGALPDISDVLGGALLDYRMDETAWSGAGAVSDSSGNGQHGTAGNGVAPIAGGKYGWAGNFVASSGHYISTPVNIDQSSTSAGITFEAWVYPTSSISTYRYVFGTDNGGYDWSVYQYGSAWYIATGNGTWSTGISADLNSWQHIVAVFIPGTGIRFYKNGGTPVTRSDIGYDTSDTNVTIGQKGNSTYSFHGRIDEAAVYGRPLTEQEVNNRYRMHLAQSGLPSGTTFKYRIWPYKTAECPWEGPYAEVLATTVTPPAPAPFTGQMLSTTQIDLKWTDNTTSETGYRLDHCPGTTLECLGDPNAIPSVAPTKAFDDPPLTFDSTFLAYSDTRAQVCAGTTHTYRVRAEPWPSAWAGPLEFTTTSAAAPTNFVLTPLTESTVGASWDDTNQDETDYSLERCLGDAACPLATGAFSFVRSFANTTPGRLVHYRMNEAAWTGAANEVVDVSGRNNHGRSYNGATTVAPGKYDRAGTFDGTNDYVATSVKVDQTATSAGATFEVWVYPTSTSGYRYVFGTDDGGTDWGLLQYGTTWYVSTGTSRYTTSIAVDLNTWQHVAVVFIPGTGIRFYKNGVELKTFTTGYLGFETSTANISIGQSGLNNYYFAGRLDEAAVYDRALTAADIFDHFQTGVNMYRFTDTSLDPTTTYTYRLKAEKTTASCPWATPYVGATATTLAPPAPENFTATPINTTRIDLSWTDKTTSETGFKLQRCTGEACTDLDSDYSDLVPSPNPGTQAYPDNKVCNDTTYRYRLRAVGAGSDGTPWETAWVYSEAKKTSVPTTPTLQTVNRISEVEILLSWTDTNADESGFRVERCVDSVCSEFTTTATPYADNELEPGRTYTYRVRAYKDADCGWVSNYSNAKPASTDLVAPVLNASVGNTTEINLSWSDTTTSESGFRVRRCQGTGCSNFEDLTPPVALAAGTRSYTDSTLCSNQTYNYQVEAFASQNGLSNPGVGCWTRRAKLTFTSFAPKTNTYIDIPYDADMRSDFGDIRFYDAKGKKDLPYWIREKTNGVSARVWLQTGENNNIYLLYGNPSATDAGNDAPFTSVYDDFRGTTIDTAKWTVTNPRNAVEQNNDLLLKDIGDTLDTLLVSTASFSRIGSPIVHFNVTIPADTVGNNYFYSGLYQNQTALSSSYLVYGVYWNNYALYLRDSTIVNLAKTYAASNTYEVKIEVKEAGGAKYWIRGGAFADWTLLRETTYNYTSPMRLAVLQQSHEARIHSFVVKQAPGALGAGLAPEENEPACFTIATNWSIFSNSDDATTRAVAVPSLTSAQAVSDTQINLLWSDGNSDETRFEIGRCTVGDDCPNYSPIDPVVGGATTYTDTTVEPSTAYSYQVRAVKDALACDWESEWSAAAGDTTFPAKAFGLAAQPYLGSRMTKLIWEEEANDEEGYEIEIQAWNGRFVLIGKTGPNATTYIDTVGIEPGREYIYRVRPFREEDKSPYSNEAATGLMPSFQTGDGTCPP